MKAVSIVLLIVVALGISFWSGQVYERGGRPKAVLTQPIQLMIGNETSVLPVGTDVMHVSSLPEGGDILKVYINYKGSPIEFESSNNWFEINSISGIRLIE